MKTATLTFHGSHNYGSMLQAYALQQMMTRIFGDNEIVNFRSYAQKRMMRVISLRPVLGPLLKDITHLLYYPSLKKKHALFEEFITDHLRVTDEIQEVTCANLKHYELICCGSDQIWNPGPEDFSLTYLLPYEDLRIKKISYAASMGPGRDCWPEPISRFPELLKGFDKISVRETGSKQVVEELSGRCDVEVNCDPVFLLEKKDWLNLIDKKPIIENGYIFLYTLFANKFIVDCAKAISRQYGLPVVISNYTNIHDLFSPFKKKLKSGPREFLNLLYNAKFIVTSSFHGTAFAIILNKPFCVVNGMKDNRISNLLRLSDLENRSIASIEEARSLAWDCDFSNSNIAITAERTRGINYLKGCL